MKSPEISDSLILKDDILNKYKKKANIKWIKSGVDG